MGRHHERRGAAPRAPWDVHRLQQALAGRGLDTRTWTGIARVDDTDEAIRWDSELGWIVDVTIESGPLHGTGPIACQLTTSFVESNGIRADPPTIGSVVAITINRGTPNDCVFIVGVIVSADKAPPGSVNGIQIDTDMAERTHIFVSDHDVQQQVGEKWRTSATSRATLEAPEVRLASDSADQSYIRGEDYADAADDFADACDTYALAVFTAFTRLTPPGPPATPVTGVEVANAVLDISIAYNRFATAVQIFKHQRGAYLSSKIKGE